MKTVVDYLKKNKKYIHDVMGRYFELELYDNGNDIGLQFENDGHIIPINGEDHVVEGLIQDILEERKIEIRFCEECGIPFDAGFTAGDGDWYCCEECFEDSMDKSYGKGNWRGTHEEGEWGGFYERLDGDEWTDTGVYWTEWY